MNKTERLKKMYFDLSMDNVIMVGNAKMWVDYTPYRSKNGRYKRFLYVEHFGRWADDFTLQSLRENCKQVNKDTDYSYTVIDFNEPF